MLKLKNYMKDLALRKLLSLIFVKMISSKNKAIMDKALTNL